MLHAEACKIQGRANDSNRMGADHHMQMVPSIVNTMAQFAGQGEKERDRRWGMSKTPETDSMSDVRLHNSEWQRFSRKLEIELDEAREQIINLKMALKQRDEDRLYWDQKWNELRDQRDEAREQSRACHDMVTTLRCELEEARDQRDRLAQALADILIDHNPYGSAQLARYRNAKSVLSYTKGIKL